MPGVTLRAIAAQHGFHLDTMRALSQREDWPPPVGMQVNARLYDEAAIDAWFAARSLGHDQWAMKHVSVEMGISLGTIKTKRKRGQFPTPDGYLGRHPWWHPDTIRDWSRRTQVPPGAWSLRDVKKHTGYRDPTGISGFPGPDGVTGRTCWWWSTTIVQWLRERHHNAASLP